MEYSSPTLNSRTQISCDEVFIDRGSYRKIPSLRFVTSLKVCFIMRVFLDISKIFCAAIL